MSYYWFNREKILKYAWDRYQNKGGKQKPANQDVLREEARNLSKEEKDKKRKFQSERDTA